jgi:hypothetical protein
MLSIFVLLAAQGASSERWTCVQEAYEGTTPVVLELSIDGEFLKEGGMEWPYRIVHNSPTEIVATWPSVGTTGGTRAINARTVVIDKISGDMIAANVDLWASDDENRPVKGRCGKKGMLNF